MPEYRARRPIHIGWALAYDTGHKVHETTVAAHGWADGDDPLVEEIPDEPLPPPGVPAFVEPSAGDESAPVQPGADEDSGVPAGDPATEEPSTPAARRRGQQK